MSEPAVNTRNSFIKAIEKHTGRAKERLLQNLGKADKTKDEIFDEFSNNFIKQQKSAEKYHKEIKNYVTCAKAVETSIENLIEIVSEIYEDEWSQKDTMISSLQSLLKIQAEYNVKLHEEILGSVNSYLGQFPEIKNKVSKRGRKLVDYDCARHSVESLQTHKKKDDVKINKAKEQLDDARQNFEPLHAELLDELPALYDSRIPFYASNLQSLFSAEMTYHNDSAGAYGQLSEGIDKLALATQKGLYDTRRKSSSISMQQSPSPPVLVKKSPITMTGNKTPVETIREINGDATPPESIKTPNGKHKGDIEPPADKTPEKSAEASPVTSEKSPSSEAAPETSSEPCPLETKKPGQTQYEIPPGATLEGLPPGVVYRVKTTYKYAAEDGDELSFEKEEVIQVVEYDDPEEKEDGWMMGIHEITKKKGLFPANFTKPI